MIHYMNVGDRDIKISNLRGNHKAGTVYCGKLVKHPGDVHYALLECDEVVEGEFPDPSSNTLGPDDRIYYGELHIRGIYGEDESGADETSSDADIYPTDI